jgi:hypothetical protein
MIVPPRVCNDPYGLTDEEYRELRRMSPDDPRFIEFCTEFFLSTGRLPIGHRSLSLIWNKYSDLVLDNRRLAGDINGLKFNLRLYNNSKDYWMRRAIDLSNELNDADHKPIRFAFFLTITRLKLRVRYLIYELHNLLTKR